MTDNFITAAKLQYKLAAVYTIIAGLLDIMVSYMVFFVFDVDSDTPDLVQDQRAQMTYQIMDVIILNGTEQCESEQSDSSGSPQSQGSFNDIFRKPSYF